VKKLSNNTYQSTTDPEARLARMGFGHESKLAYCGNLLIENRTDDARGFVREMRERNETPHVSENTNRPGGSAIDGRTPRHTGYQVSQRKRKRIEEVFGWLKTVGMSRKTRHRGIYKVAWVFTFAAAANNLVRMRNLAVVPSA